MPAPFATHFTVLSLVDGMECCGAQKLYLNRLSRPSPANKDVGVEIGTGRFVKGCHEHLRDYFGSRWSWVSKAAVAARTSGEGCFGGMFELRKDSDDGRDGQDKQSG